ncbi:MAG: YkgJ family cysteine cluster protein [Promethearchaeota archaeon]|jgi:Fe-S-cluster containining protein
MIDCENCKFNHACCRNYGVVLQKDEISKIDYRTLTHITKDGKVVGVGWRITFQEDGSCAYLDAISKKCKIYEHKPKACNNWKECELW